MWKTNISFYIQNFTYIVLAIIVVDMILNIFKFHLEGEFVFETNF